jgi:hypothetical protein
MEAALIAVAAKYSSLEGKVVATLFNMLLSGRRYVNSGFIFFPNSSKAGFYPSKSLDLFSDTPLLLYQLFQLFVIAVKRSHNCRLVFDFICFLFFFLSSHILS